MLTTWQVVKSSTPLVAHVLGSEMLSRNVSVSIRLNSGTPFHVIVALLMLFKCHNKRIFRCVVRRRGRNFIFAINKPVGFEQESVTGLPIYSPGFDNCASLYFMVSIICCCYLLAITYTRLILVLAKACYVDYGLCLSWIPTWDHSLPTESTWSMSSSSLRSQDRWGIKNLESRVASIRLSSRSKRRWKEKSLRRSCICKRSLVTRCF
jgi:hypothetical protein